MDLHPGLREHLVELLRGGNAHMDFGEVIADFPEARINAKPPNLDYSFWHLLEHLRLTQADVLDYLTNTDYAERDWPAEYWPARDAEATKDEWDGSVAAFRSDLEKLVAMVSDPRTDLFGGAPTNPEHTVLREALIVADHNAYHIGEMGVLRQIADAWGPSHAP